MITSVNNEQIKEIAKLKEKKYRDSENLFLVEGSHLVEEAYKNKLLKKAIMVSDFEFLLDIEKIIVTKEIMKKLSDTSSPARIIGVVEKKKDAKLGNKLLLLDGIQDPGNLGTIIRSSVAFGFDTIVASTETVDLYNPKVIRSTQGMLFNTNIIVRDLEEFILSIKKNDYIVLGTKVKGGIDINDIEVHKKFALIIGNEGNGISDKIIKLCDEYLYISMKKKCESLNAGVAASILMYEMSKR